MRHVCKERFKSFLQSFAVQISDNTLSRFGHDLSIQVLYDFIGFAFSSTHTTAVRPVNVEEKS